MRKNCLINLLVVFFLSLCIFSCTSKRNNYLNKGLFELKNKSIINEDFIEGFTLNTFGIIKSEEKNDTYKLVFLLNNDVVKEVVENYAVTIRVVSTEEEEDKKTKPELFWDFKPKFIEKNGHKYMIHTVTTKLKKIKQLRFALYHRDGYQGATLSKVISVKNISLY